MSKPAKAKAPKPPKIHVLDAAHPLVALAIGSLKATKAQREQVEPGEYSIDVTLHLTAEIDVAEDHEAPQVNAIDPWTLITLLLDRIPGTEIEDIIDNAAAIVALKVGTDDGERATAIKERAETAYELACERVAAAVDIIKGSTVQMKKGKVSISEPSLEVLEQSTDNLDDA